MKLFTLALVVCSTIFGAENNRSLFPEQKDFVNLGMARQSQIDTIEEHHSREGKGEEESRFGKVIISPDSQKPTESGLYSPEKEVEMLEACGRNEKVTFSQALRELLPGITDPYFDETYLELIEKVEAGQFDGEYTIYWDNGQLCTRVTFVNGIPDGHFHGWYPNGGEAFKGYLDMGEKRGVHISFFYTDRVYKEKSPHARILFYNNQGQLHGEQKASYPRGRLKAFVKYSEGKRNGNFSLYKPEGGAFVEKYFQDGKEAQTPKK